jgi:Zn-finger nucleic acid-binding protein
MFAMSCPKCGAAMSAYLGDASAICLSCGGTWIPAAAHVSRLGQLTGRDVADELAIVLATGARVTSLRCPGCTSEALHAVTLRGIEIESCRACHGVFLDCGEVERLKRSRPRFKSASAGFVADVLDGPGGVVLDLLVELLAGVVSLALGG